MNTNSSWTGIHHPYEYECLSNSLAAANSIFDKPTYGEPISYKNMSSRCLQSLYAYVISMGELNAVWEVLNKPMFFGA